MDERVNVLVDAFRRTTEQGVTLEGILIVVFLFSFIVLSLVFSYKLKIYFQEHRLKKIFFEYSENIGLTRDEAEIIWETSKKIDRDPYLSLEVKQTFEKIIDYYIKTNPEFDENKIRHMRKVLGFDYIPPFIPLTSTKDIDLYQSATLISDKGSFNIALVDKDELYMYWAILDNVPVRLNKGDSVKINFLRTDDAYYSFEDKIEDIYKEKDRYIVKIPHTFHLVRTQKRKEIRIKINVPVEVHIDKMKINAETENVSLGGLKFCIYKSENDYMKILRIGKYIYLRLKIGSSVIITEAKIKNILEKEDMICVGVEFVDLDKEYKQILSDFITKKQMEIMQQYKKQKGL